MTKHFARILVGLLLVALFLGNCARWVTLPLVERLEAIAYDARLRLTMPGTLDPRIVIVDIDERSLQAEGRWPWGRDKLARLVDQLFDRYQVAVAGFDIVFAEPDGSSGLAQLEALAAGELSGNAAFESALRELRSRLAFDELLAARLRDRPVVLGYYFSNAGGAEGGASLTVGRLPDPVLAAGTFSGRNIRFTRWSGHGANLPALQAAAASAGHFNQLTDTDGVARRVPMLAEFNGAYYESLSLAVVRLLLGSPGIEPGEPAEAVLSRGYSGLEWLNVGPLRLPVDELVTSYVPYRGPRGSFTYVSATDVLAGRVDPQKLEKRVVLVGTSAPGLFDLRSTPVAPVFPGVEIHANLIAGMLDGNIRQRPPYVLGAEFLLLLATGLLLVLWLPWLSPARATALFAGTVALTLGINFAVWQYGNLILPIASGLLLIALLYTFNMAWGFFVEARGKRQITGLFGQYVPPELVDEMAKDPGRFSMEGESRELSVLFTDVRGFTTISEGLDPKALASLMNTFLTPLTRIIYRHRGTIDKYMGDAIMAFWGAPVDDPDHAANAVAAALEMQATLAALQPQFKERGWPPIRIGVGINTGRMSVGNMGSEIRLAYTVMGDAVNLASRLEGITKEYGADIIVGEAVCRAAPGFHYVELDRVRVKGKDEPVAIFEPIGRKGEVGQAVLDQAALFQKAVKLFRSQNWDLAEVQLLNLQKVAPGRKLYELYLERVAIYRADPPPADWNGVFVFQTK
ncbi:MAG: adenylate/guanylate cyclase domain-containing protein [Betaproteobacteria bacterium]|nr:adenylate/guanylate cyclase domain-containing protein [Betaproteobacteria bacterium]